MQKHRPRIFLRLFLPIAVLLLAGMAFYGDSKVERELARLWNQESLNVGLGAGALAHDMEAITRDLQFLASHSALIEALNSPTAENLLALSQDFVNFSRSKGIYDQIRWLDETGMERTRVDFRRDTPRVVPIDKLQNKARRYYFADAFKLKSTEIFVSPLDLNIEHGKVEIPFKPMIRVGTPVFDEQGEKRGIVLLNYYGSDLLLSFTTATANIAGHVTLLNNDGYWLKSPNTQEEWGFMLGRVEMTLGARSPVAWKLIQSQKSGQQALEDGLWSWETVYPLQAGHRSSSGASDAFTPSAGMLNTGQYAWKIVAHLSAHTLGAVKQEVWQTLLLISLLLLVLISIGCWKLAQAWADLAEAEEEVRRINAGLEQLVSERTRELKDKVTELDDALGELGRRNEEMESMIYIASHDLRSPLVNIQGFSQRLEKAAGDINERLAHEDVPQAVQDSLARLLTERIPTALDFIKSGSEKMEALINGLLRLSRAGREKLYIESLDMNAQLSRMTEELTIQIESAETRVTMESLPRCQGDASQLNQVFTNLIVNAIKYREPSRPLEIHIMGRQEKGLAIYEITDNGIGIPQKHQSKIWQLFHRLDTTGPVSGEGIGLTLVQRILDRLGGRIRLVSLPGEGSRFIVELPASDEEV